MTIKLSVLKKRNQFKKRLSAPQVGVAKTFGNFDNTPAKWIGGCIAGDGNIYGAPYNSNSILKIDPIVGTATTISAPVPDSSSNYRGIVCGQNKKLYLIPTSRTLSGVGINDTDILEFDPKNNSYNFITSSVAGNWFGGVLANNGKIYGIPFTSTSILEIDPSAGTATTFTSPSSGFIGGVRASNGKIYGIPYSARTVLEIDPNTGTATNFGSLSSGGNKWAHGVLANNGKIYGIPYWATSVLEIDPITRTVSTFGESSDIWSSTDPGWASGVLGSDGKIYAFPNNNAGVFTDYILKIDPDTKTLSLDYITPSRGYIGAATAPNGKIYGIPGDSSSVVSIGVSAANKSPDWVVKPYENRPRVGFTTVLSNVGPSTAIYQYISGCLGNDGKIYAFPYGFYTNGVLEIDPIKETVEFGSTISDHIENNYNYGPQIISSVALKNGEICGIPQNRDTAIFYDPKTKQYTETNQITVTAQWASGTLAPNDGKIYCPPFRSNVILVINTNTKTLSTNTFSPVGTYTNPYAVQSNWAGSVLAPNGKIYGIPTYESRVLEIDPITNTTTTFGSLGTSADKWWGGVLAPNGKIYGIPFASTSILEIDPIKRTASTFENTTTFLSSGEYSYTGILGADNKIYIIPFNHNKILRLDPETKTLSLYGYLPNNTNVFAGVLAPNGNIYMIPCGNYEVTSVNIVYTQGALVSIGTTQSYAPANWMLSSYTNKSI